MNSNPTYHAGIWRAVAAASGVAEYVGAIINPDLSQRVITVKSVILSMIATNTGNAGHVYLYSAAVVGGGYNMPLATPYEAKGPCAIIKGRTGAHGSTLVAITVGSLGRILSGRSIGYSITAAGEAGNANAELLADAWRMGVGEALIVQINTANVNELYSLSFAWTEKEML